MQWFYLSERQERISAAEDQLPALAAAGVLRPATLVWRDGMDSWLSAGELKPEIFLAPVSGTDAGEAAEEGLVVDLAAVMSRYAGWLSVSGGMHFGSGVMCTAVAVATGYFAILRPERLLDWKTRTPAFLGPVFDHPWWTVGILSALALLSFFSASQLLTGASRIRRAARLRTREDLRNAVRMLGAFFRTAVLTVLAGLVLLAAAVVWQTRKTPAPAENPPASLRDRVAI